VSRFRPGRGYNRALTLPLARMRTAELSMTEAATTNQKSEPDAIDVSLADIQAAKNRIAPFVWRTALLPTATLSRMTGATLRIKTENLQRTGSFKARGAVNAILQLDDSARARGVVTFSAGNHGQGLAYAARIAGVRCTVFMAANAVPTKIEAIRGYGAETRFGTTIQEAFDMMQRFQTDTGATFVSPFADAAIIAGQGTVGLELLEDFPEVEQIIVPIGGGGLIAGIALAVKSLRPEVRIVGVEPEGSKVVYDSLQAGEPLHARENQTIADGLGAPFTSALPFTIIQKHVDDVVLVTDDEIRDALFLILDRCKLLVEPAGAAATAALLTGKAAVPTAANTVSILSGGNIDLARLKSLL
jgi:threonine dehydratase